MFVIKQRSVASGEMIVFVPGSDPDPDLLPCPPPRLSGLEHNSATSVSSELWNFPEETQIIGVMPWRHQPHFHGESGLCERNGCMCLQNDFRCYSGAFTVSFCVKLAWSQSSLNWCMNYFCCQRVFQWVASLQLNAQLLGPRFSTDLYSY